MLILRDEKNGVGVISFNRPEVHNAFNDAMGEAFRDALVWARETRSIRVVVLRAEGRSFCSGRDTRTLGDARSDGITDRDIVVAGQESRKMILDLGKPVIAAVRGNALGGGAEMALVADFRVAADDLRLAFPEVLYGLAVDTGGSPFLTMLAGPSRAKWLLMSGEPIGAAQALAWGLVDWVVPPAELDAKTMEIAAKLARNPFRAMMTAKEYVDAIWEPDVRAGLARELAGQLPLYHDPDFIRIREERRKPKSPRG